ncbi:MAG: response regulator [Acidobacteriota bacterium]
MGSKKVLLVDDEEDILFFLRVYLETRGFDVNFASELEEAESLLANECYSVVVLDLRLTRLDISSGLTLIKFIRKQCLDIGIIVLTAYGSEEVEKEARSLGADMFLHKPQPLSEIDRRISSLMNVVL